MNINQTLLGTIGPNLIGYSCRTDDIKDFMMSHTSFLERQAKAIQIIDRVMNVHGKKALLSHVVELARVEHGIRELEPWVRDHVVHALLTFILGIYINERFIRYTSNYPVDNFQWKLACLFHDIGYPIQLARDIIKPFVEKINEIKTRIGVPASDLSFRIVPSGIENLQRGINSFDLIQQRINDWNLCIDVKKEYNQMIDSGIICHGIISALAILYVTDLMYQKHNPVRNHIDIYSDKPHVNWNQIYFENDVISACTAIYIHNLPDRCFCNSKIDRLKAPLAFLLKLSDILQEWERPSADNPGGLESIKFDIEVSNDKLLIFHIDLSDEKGREIKNKISSFLVASDVQIHKIDNRCE